MPIETRPLSEHVGVEVLGLDLDAPIDAATRRILQDIFVDTGVLLFRGGNATPEAQLALSRCFGELERHPIKENWVAGYPDLIDISYRPAAPGASSFPRYEVEGKRLGGWLPWHSDLVFMDKINRGGLLRAITVPRTGGKTGFIDQSGAYETLPSDIKRRIEGLSVAYRMEPDFTRHRHVVPKRFSLLARTREMDSLSARLDDFPPVLHPMVFKQPETGRKVLNISPTFAIGIYGMDEEEGDALLTEVISHMVNPARAYFHDWQTGDMVLWDNWRTLHSAEGVPEDCTREMQRTTIAGDYALGRRLEMVEVHVA